MYVYVRDMLYGRAQHVFHLAGSLPAPFLLMHLLRGEEGDLARRDLDWRHCR
jgi:hypothetical protein